MNLKELQIGKSAVITAVGGEGALRQHFLDMGVIPGAEVTVVKLAPMGDPMELQIHGYELTLRLADAEKIIIEPIAERSNAHKRIESIPRVAHPGLGETGKYHDASCENPLPDDTVLTYALMGNQNCGKTSLFNQLTGANQHVGNFPGVTVSFKHGVIRGYPKTRVTDLPGIYSMSPYTSEEIVSRDFVLKEKPHAIINIVDATNIERNLYLTMQLLEMEIPMVVALNMMDEVMGNGGSIAINEMENCLGVPVVPISAIKGQGIDELIRHAIHIAKYQEKPLIQDFCSRDDHGGAIHRAHHTIQTIIEDHAERAGLPVRFAANKVIEGDHLIIDQLALDKNEMATIEHVIVQMEEEGGMDRSAAIADMRFDYIERVCESTVIKGRVSKERVRSERIDKLLTGKWTAIPCFIGIIALMFYLTFHVIGGTLQGLLENGITALSDAVEAWMNAVGVSPIVHGLVIDGIFGGVGSVLSFLPIVVILFFFLSLMEDSGYAARVAFFMDKFLRKIGLSGRSIVPMLIGFGCSVPAVMSTRILPSSRDRKLTTLLVPFMSCTAKLPIYAFFVSAFFPQNGALIMVGLYLLSIVIGIIFALITKNTVFKGEAVPFVMELPNYRMPSAKNTLRLMWDKAKDFLSRAFTVILIATIVIWFLQSFDMGLQFTADSGTSILAGVAGFLAPIFKPMGLGDWRIVTSFISGFMAKESVVSTMEVLFAGQVGAALTKAGAMAMLIFSLLYAPCIATIATIRRELGNWWAAGVLIWQCVIAWIAAYGAYLVCGMMGM
ncbi:MAG: ferrous iron transport protein B [Lachnospiraceae bacterium]|nr:ferrous iron transport protein B [Lachnospiraceae bacterium]